MARLPYSNKHPNRETGEKIQRIRPPAGCTEFRSEITTRDNGATLCWEQAWQNPATNRWMVEEHFVTAAGPGELRTLWAQGVSFFDALHECAAFENFKLRDGFENFDGRATIATDILGDPDIIAIPHYLSACKDAGQAWDDKNFPLPTVGGHVLTNGESVYLDQEARAAAKKSRHTELLPSHLIKKSSAQDLLNTFTKENQTADEAINDSVQKLAQSVEVKHKKHAQNLATNKKMEAEKKRIEKQFNAAIQTAATIQQNIRHMIGHEFSGEWIKRYQEAPDKIKNGIKKSFREKSKVRFSRLFIATPLFCAITPLVDICRTTITFGKGINCDYPRMESMAPDINFSRQLSKLHKQANKLPDENVKTMLHDFAQAAQAAKHMEYAVYLKRKSLEEKKEGTIKKLMNKGLSEIHKAAVAMELSAEDTENLKLSYTAMPETKVDKAQRPEQFFLYPYYFLNQINERRRTIESAIKKLAEQSTTQNTP